MVDTEKAIKEELEEGLGLLDRWSFAVTAHLKKPVKKFKFQF